VQFATAGMDNKLFVSRYRTALPTAEQLQRFVEADRDRIEAVTKRRPRSNQTKRSTRRAPARTNKRRRATS
jgi:hypothetical protein